MTASAKAELRINPVISILRRHGGRPPTEHVKQ
jgi:hypothetical protein